MSRRERAPRALMVLSLLALGTLLGTLMATGGEAEPAPTHPEIDSEVECQVCHAEVTPEVVKDWFAGPHGEMSVKCFVCHGPTGEGFMKRPAAVRCIGCHADQVATLEQPEMKGKSCFSCHPNHRLKAHAPASGKGGPS